MPGLFKNKAGDKPGPKPFKVRLKYYSILIIAAGFIFFMLTGNYGLYKMWCLSREITNLEKQLEQAEKTNDSLIKEKERLINEDWYIEKVAREKLGMAKPGEKVYKFIKKNKENKNAENN
ncbi:MAG: septum formation initiator family protein [bacterium]